MPALSLSYQERQGALRRAEGGASASGSGSALTAPRLLAFPLPSGTSPPSRSWEREKPPLRVAGEALGAFGRVPRPPHLSLGALPDQVLTPASTGSGRMEPESVCVCRDWSGSPSPGWGGGRGDPGWGAGRRVFLWRVAGVEWRVWGRPLGGVSGGQLQVAGEAPVRMQKTSAEVDWEFATWRIRSERGSILPGQKGRMDLVRVVGAIPCFPCLPF